MILMNKATELQPNRFAQQSLKIVFALSFFSFCVTFGQFSI